MDVLDINPKLLEKMQKDPKAAKEYSQRIKDVENAHKFVDNYLKYCAIFIKKIEMKFYGN